MLEFDVDAAHCAAGACRRPRETAGQPWNDNTRSQPRPRLAISRAPVFRVRRSSLSTESKVSITEVPITRPPLSTGGWHLRAGSTSRVACTAKALALCPVESTSKSGGRAVACQASVHTVHGAAHDAYMELAASYSWQRANQNGTQRLRGYVGAQAATATTRANERSRE